MQNILKSTNKVFGTKTSLYTAPKIIRPSEWQGMFSLHENDFVAQNPLPLRGKITPKS
jgi:hypothetical protein